MTEFTCEKCFGIFKKGWGDDAALKEYSVSPWNIPGDKKGLVCDNCFQEFVQWFDSLTPEQHETIKNGFANK